MLGGHARVHEPERRERVEVGRERLRVRARESRLVVRVVRGRRRLHPGVERALVLPREVVVGLKELRQRRRALREGGRGIDDEVRRGGGRRREPEGRRLKDLGGGSDRARGRRNNAIRSDRSPGRRGAEDAPE
eukprot:31068-Pelagococcus_subviridis.AAC.6